MAKISIIVPFYNSEKYVKRCMDSLLHQTIGLSSLELILVDDASTDRTLDLLKEYERQYPEQIILIPCVQNGRQGTARNIGLQYATSPYIGFVDSDDWVEADMYEKMYHKITAHDCDIVFCRHVRDDGNMKVPDSRENDNCPTHMNVPDNKENNNCPTHMNVPDSKEIDNCSTHMNVPNNKENNNCSTHMNVPDSKENNNCSTDKKKQNNVYEKATGKKDAMIVIENDQQREALFINTVIGMGVWDKLYKRELLFDNHITFPDNLAYEDQYFGSLIYLYVNRIYILEERLYHYFVNWESTILMMDQAYHQDIFTVNEIKWQEYEKRGALKRFPVAIKYDFIKCYYLLGMKMLLLRYTKPSYEVFLHIKRRVWELAGDYKENPYLKNAFPAIYDNLLKLLDLPVSEQEFLELADIMKRLADSET